MTSELRSRRSAVSPLRSKLLAQSRVDPAPLIVVATALLCLMYVLRTPQMPDLAAQVARTDVARTQGSTTWWTGWYGGLALPTYSLLAPRVMATLGPPLVGALAVVGTAIAGVKVTSQCLRPRLGATSVAAFSFLDLFDGRVTFALGVAFAVWAIVSLQAGRLVATVSLTVLAFAASPLAGLFLGIVVSVCGVLDPTRRRPAVFSAVSLLALSVATAILFPGTGTMPFSPSHAIPPTACCLAVLVFSRVTVVRAVTATVLVVFLVCLLVPTPVGGNVTRLVWLAAVPALVATASAPRWLFPVVICAVSVWPCSDVVGQFLEATTPSAHDAYYRPLLSELSREQAGESPQSLGERVELVDTANHWGAYYLDTVPLARGWDRQADVGYDPIFYNEGLLTAASYRAWLDSLAVRWVAVPSAQLDYASAAEARLVGTGLDYLRLVWSSHDWKLYEVEAPVALVSGAQVVGISGSGIAMQTSGTTTVTVRERWNPYVVITDPGSGRPARGCVRDAGGWIEVVVPRAETFTVTSQFALTSRFIGKQQVLSSPAVRETAESKPAGLQAWNLTLQ